MKKLAKLRLRTLNEQYLAEKQMNALKGGQTCFCSCYWAGQGGSSSIDNRNANYNLASEGGYYKSEHGCNQHAYDGLPLCCPDCNETNHDIYYDGNCS
jgi:natural product precursor